MRLTVLVLGLGLGLGLGPVAPALAVGSDSPAPSSDSRTASDCKQGEVWDEKTKTCADARDSRLDDATRTEALRALAHAGQLDWAAEVLEAFDDPRSDIALTYRGFLARKMGDRAAGMGWYDAALAQNPDNLLARAYKGMAHAEAGEITLARAELTEIRRRGGRGSWPELALRLHLEDGPRSSY